MRLFEVAVSAACLATTVAAAPTAQGKQRGFTAAQNARPLVAGKNGAMMYRRALRRYGVEIPSDVNDAAERHHAAKVATAAAGTSGSVQAPQEQYDSEYLTPVTVGGSTLNLDIDTGSSDMWVFSDLLSAAETQGHDIYKTKSAAFTGARAVGSSWYIQYGDNSEAEGTVFNDKVTLAGITAAKQAVEAATNISPSLAADRNSDGIFGFGFSNINNVQPKPALTWFDNVKGSLASPVFAAALKHNAPGYYDFGYLNSSRYTGDIAYTPVNSKNGFWESTIDGYYVGGTAHTGKVDIIADTGTSLILGSVDMVENYWNQVASAQVSPEEGGIVYDCSDSLPDFSLVINGQKRTIPGSYMNYAQTDSGTCFGGLQAADLPFVIVGDVFLKGQYVVFDAGKTQLGFAQAA